MIGVDCISALHFWFGTGFALWGPSPDQPGSPGEDIGDN